METVRVIFASFGAVVFCLIIWAVVAEGLDKIRLWLIDQKTTRRIANCNFDRIDALSTKVDSLNQSLQILTAKVNNTQPKKKGVK